MVTALLILVISIAGQGVAAQTATPTASTSLIIPTPDPEARDLAPVQAQEPYRLALLVPFPQDPFWQDVQQAVVDRAKSDGVTIDVVALTSPSVPEQLGQIEDAIAQGYSGILLGAVDAVGIAPGIAAANAAGVPVLAIDTVPVGGDVISIVRTDNVAAARIAGQFIGSELDGNGVVLNVQGDLRNSVAQERDLGLRDGLVAFPDVSITSGDAGWDQSRAYLLTSTQLPIANEGTPTPPRPLVDAIFAANPSMALGAAQAIEDAKADSVIVVGFGNTPDVLNAIQVGVLEATIAEFPTRAGTLAVDLLVRHLNGESTPHVVDSGFTLVTEETLHSFLTART
jgi:ribose transport system substrate-binding protein